MLADPLDLSRLNATEREALNLLAAGHTVKSIAVLTGRSEGAVNERLRDAWRKTGIGSSRELARRLREQENRDEQIGVALPISSGADLDGLVGGRHRRFPRIVVMIAIIAAAGAVALGISTTLPSPQTAPSPAADPLVDAAVGSLNDTPQAQRQRFLAEPRDPVWAPRTEAVLAAAYSAIDGLAPGLRIRCARTLCEVAGHSMSGNDAALNRTMQKLQGKTLLSELAAAGLRSPAASFGGPGKTNFTFVAYWTSAKL